MLNEEKKKKPNPVQKPSQKDRLCTVTVNVYIL